ncbi:hypothetical protein KCG44_06025 [Pacificimonas sp. WHA3]|uniref:Uncharacterized protein n=1 Tax=Pacificimonas pallii TaxID=2827236 RepID=A0ABS6SD40_9SPHN|nr:hypothetical protein [Pacificimonas pallii]MBV7256342.1 hypothetical protein [Pacificimonas pallii]
MKIIHYLFGKGYNMSIMVEIDRCIRSGSHSATRLGREAVGDPRLVFDMRRGRQLRPETEEKIMNYLAGLHHCLPETANCTSAREAAICAT